METLTHDPTDVAIDCDVIDGADLFVDDRFVAAARCAAQSGRNLVAAVPDLSVAAGRLTGTSGALLHVFVETRMREALRRAGFTHVERQVSPGGRAWLVGTK